MSSIGKKIHEYREKSTQKSIFLKAVALVLALAVCVAIVGDNKFATRAWAADGDFDVYTYIADNILSEETNASYRFNSYFNIIKSKAEDLSRCFMTKEFADSVRTWENANVALDPSSALDKPIDARGYYASIIFDMLQITYGDNKFILDKLLNKNIKNGSKIYTNFANIFKQYSNMELGDYLAKTDHTEDEENLLVIVQKAYLHDNKFVASAQGVDDLLNALKAGKKVNEYINNFLSYCALADVSKEWYICVKKMREHCDNSNAPLRNALDLILEQMEADSYMESVMQIGIDIAQEGGTYLLSKGVGELWEKVTGPVGVATKWGKMIGGSISNFIFGTDKTIEAYYTVNAYCIVLDLFKKSFEDIKKQYQNNPTTENASLFLRAVDMYFNLFETGNKFGQEFLDVLYTGGIANKLFRSQKEYQSQTEQTKKLSEYAKDAHAVVMSYWLIDLYSDESVSNNIDLYNKYIDIIGSANIPNELSIPVGSVSFEKDAVEWGLNDYEYKGYECTVLPENAGFKDLVYTSSDSNVAEITSTGSLMVNGLGTCTITATSVENDEISDTLNVTVVEGNGADSVKAEHIEPIAPPKPQDSGLKFTELSNGTYEVSGLGDNSAETLTEITIPSTYNGKKVTVIGDYVFSGCKVLTSVTIPESIVKIDSCAFQNCISLKSVVIPKSVRTIANGAFSGCSSLKSVTLPEGLTMLGEDYDSYYYVGAFENCTSLETVTIPKSVRIIGYWAFRGCTKLKSVIIPENVTKICGSAFYNCKSLSSVTISNSVTIIGGSAFSYCTSLTTVDIPDGVTTVGNYAFNECKSLSSITIPDSVTTIGEHAFHGCISLPSVKIPGSVTSIEQETFLDCKSLKSVTIPNSITTIRCKAFSGCTSLKSITIPNSVTDIAVCAFEFCTSLSSISIPGSVIAFGGFFQCTGLKSATISEGVTTIRGDDAVNTAFSYCKNLESVFIPKSVTVIGEYAFYSCGNLKDVYYVGTESEWNEIKIGSSNSNLLNANIHYNTTTPPDFTDKATVNINIPKPIGSAIIDVGVKAILQNLGGNVAELPIDKDGSIDISEIPDGSYTFTFSADNCAPRDYTASIQNGSLIGLDDGVELRLYGDVDDAGDGIVDIRDVAKANQYFKTGEGLSGYMLTVSDVNRDGVIDIRDVAQMNAHFKGAGNLWEE